ncbi:MAG: hypothetical protein HZB56_13215 [Deltaproteobacteria bacterium]|nr:hypothetical protein [Deltaproteobacteria bacterium]
MKTTALRPLAVAAALAASGCAGPAAAPPPEAPPHRISGGASAGPLQVERVELLFPNGRGEIAVRRNAGLTARALIRFRGSGPLLARWAVDGMPVEQVSLLATFGDTLTLDTSTALPTFEPGRHRLALELLQPIARVSLRSISYVVTAEEADPGGRP